MTTNTHTGSRGRKLAAALLAAAALTTGATTTPAFAPSGPYWMPAHAAATK